MSYEVSFVNASSYGEDVQPVSRTYQYRKVMKPMLERKRRARINRCLDELKELMVTALQAEGENVAKLEKADILELTVRHLHGLRRRQKLAASPVAGTDRFRAGFTHAAAEVSRCLAATPGVDVALGTRLMTHLGHRLNDMDKVAPLSVRVSPCSSPAPSNSSCASPCASPASSGSYELPPTPACSPPPSPASPLPLDCSTAGLLRMVNRTEAVWRPW